MEVTVLHNQSISDVLLQYTGSLLDIVKFCTTNNVSVTKQLVPGAKLVLPDDIANNTNIANFYTAKKIIPAFAVKGGSYSTAYSNDYD